MTPPPETVVVPREPFLAQLRRVNTERYEAWVGDGADAGILFDAAELGGEVGELLNVVKKLVREENGWRGSRASPQDFADECADVLICLDKLARRRSVDLEAATIAKFNATSEKQSFPHRLAAAPTPPVPEPALLDSGISHETLSREAYEGTGGWNDGRWGQAYDLIYAALKDAGWNMGYDHPILHEIELEGGSYASPCKQP